MSDKTLLCLAFAGIQVLSGLLMWAMRGPDLRTFLRAKGIGAGSSLVAAAVCHYLG